MKRLILLFSILFAGVCLPKDLIVIKSDYCPKDDSLYVFTPNDYKATEKYPLLVLLHGWSGSYRQWENITDLQEYANKYGFVIVCPDGFFDCWYLDSPLRKDSQYEKFFFSDLMPEIFSKYSLEKKKIFISGLSMGGHGAISLFLKHQDFFLSAGSTSGTLDIRDLSQGQINRFNLSKLLGDRKKDSLCWQNNSAYCLLKKYGLKDKEIIFDCGTEDFTFGTNQKFYRLAVESKAKFTFIARPGAHNSAYWKNAIGYQMMFFKNLSMK